MVLSRPQQHPSSKSSVLMAVHLIRMSIVGDALLQKKLKPDERLRARRSLSR